MKFNKRKFFGIGSYSQHFSCEPNGLWRFQRWQITEKGYNALIRAETPKQPKQPRFLRFLEALPPELRQQTIDAYNNSSGNNLTLEVRYAPPKLEFNHNSAEYLQMLRSISNEEIARQGDNP